MVHAVYVITFAQYIVTVPRNEHFEVPRHLSPIYTGQKEVGQRLETALMPSSYGRSHQRRFVLWGLGGPGKTQTCLKYI